MKWYGLWRDGEWWWYQSQVFATPSVALAHAQRMVANEIEQKWSMNAIKWQVREIGEDGLPVSDEKAGE